MSADETIQATRVILRPLASPLGLGLVSLAGASLPLAALQLGWIAPTQRQQVGLLLLVVAPVPQLVASVFGFLARDPIVASGMGWLSGTWLGYALIELTSPPGTTSPALGSYLMVAGVGLVILSLGADGKKGVASLTLALAGTRFGCSALFELTGASGWRHASGWLGVAVCVAALYSALALAIEDLRRRPVLPTLRRGRSREMFDQPLSAQLADVTAEAGVRRQL